MKNKESSTRAAFEKGNATSRADETQRIEFCNSPKTRHTDENAGIVFTTFVFLLTLIVVMLVGFLIWHSITIYLIAAALCIAALLAYFIRIAPQWERVVILRLGKYNRTCGPGPYFVIPFVEHAALHADLRMMLTGFSAEETLTSDLVPVNVDAAIFWVIWDATKACLEVEDYYDSVSLASQTALRDAIGRNSIAEVTSRRVQLDAELKNAIEEKTTDWGISILAVEIRNIVIPRDLQEAMSAEARAEREKDARVILAEVESDIASMLRDASKIYREDDIALKLRQMHLLNESMKETKGSVVVPSAYAEGFNEYPQK